HELVYVGVAFGVFRRTYGGAGEGWSSARELESGNRHPNSSNSHFRLAGRFPNQHGAALENRNQDLDLSRAVGHCYRIVLALLFPRLAAGPSLPVAPVDKLSVVIAIALAAIFLHEKMT